MVQRVQVLLEDDLEGGAADETVHFALDGKSYAIDLNEGNAEKLRTSLEPYIESARKRAGSVSVRRTHRAAASREDASKIREWAKDHGFDISDRGRVPANVREAYEKAH